MGYLEFFSTIGVSGPPEGVWREKSQMGHNRAARMPPGGLSRPGGGIGPPESKRLTIDPTDPIGFSGWNRVYRGRGFCLNGSSEKSVPL